MNDYESWLREVAPEIDSFVREVEDASLEHVVSCLEAIRVLRRDLPKMYPYATFGDALEFANAEKTYWEAVNITAGSLLPKDGRKAHPLS